MKGNLFMKIPFLPNRHRVKVALACLQERLLGLDFSLPDRMYDRGRGDGAMYLKTEDEIFYEMLSYVDKDRFRRFLDVGSGKGYVLWKAKQWGFERVGGVEYDEQLYRICCRNMKKLGIHKQVEITCCDACTYENYGDYDVFYFFNPFVENVLESVINRIISQCRGKEILLIYYRPRYAQTIEKWGCFVRIAALYDPEKEYGAYIYRGKIPEKILDK